MRPGLLGENDNKDNFLATCQKKGTVFLVVLTGAVKVCGSNTGHGYRSPGQGF